MRVFIDMDGVVADYRAAALAAVRRLYFGGDIGEDPGPGYDLWGPLGLTEDEFFECQTEDPNFWADIPVYPGAREWVAEIDALARGDVWFLSAPSRHPQCHSGKACWLLRELGVKMDRLVVTKSKFLLARHRGDILVDDLPQNLVHWREAGGTPIRFRQPWNAALAPPTIAVSQAVTLHLLRGLAYADTQSREAHA